MAVQRDNDYVGFSLAPESTIDDEAGLAMDPQLDLELPSASSHGAGSFLLSSRWPSCSLMAAVGLLLCVAAGVLHSVPKFGTPQIRNLEKDNPSKEEREELIETQYDPAVCFGRLSDASAMAANLGFKITAIIDECDPKNYIIEEDPFRRLGKLIHHVRKLPGYRSLEWPASPLGLNNRGRLSVPGVQSAHAMAPPNLLPAAQTSYNLSRGDLMLKTRYALGKNWTLEGWHYFEEHHHGSVWVTSSDTEGQQGHGLVACLTEDGFLCLEIAASRKMQDGSNETGKESSFVVGTVAVPLSSWVHLVWQRRGDSIELFVDGAPAGKGTVAAGLDETSPQRQANIALGRPSQKNLHDKYQGLVSNMRLTTSTVYTATSFTPSTNLDLLPKTRFLLKDHFVDVVTGRQMKRAGIVGDVLDPEEIMNDFSDGDVASLNESSFQLDSDFVDADNETWSPRGGGSTEADEVELRPAFCARTIAKLIDDTGRLLNQLLRTPKYCAHQTVAGIGCAIRINSVIQKSASTARYGSDLRVRCNQNIESIDGYFRCSEELEDLTWGLDGLGSSISGAMRECSSDPITGSPLLDYGACVGELSSAAGYVAASALIITTSADLDCYSAQTLEQKKELAFDPEAREMVTLECARDATAAVRTMSLAASKAIRGAGHCGGTNTLCGRSIARSAAALSGAAEVAVFMRVYCRKPVSCCDYNPDIREFECKCDFETVKANNEDTVDDQRQCTRYSGSMTKLLASAAIAAAEAQGQCNNMKTAANTCAALVPTALAAFGFLVENAARITRDCPRPRDEDDRRQAFSCGQEVTRIGSAMRLAASSIAGSIVNCGFGNVKRITKPLSLPRRFFVP